MLRYFLLACFAVQSCLAISQNLVQTIRGTVVDQTTENPIPGASVVILNSNPLIGTTCDLDGHFRLPQVSIGRYDLKISLIGYQDLILPNVLVGAGKEIVLNIKISERVTEIKAVEIVAGSNNKAEAINELASVSARQFSVEETKRYAGALNDPGRMALSFAGVTSNSDGSNEIVVRGNSPRGLLWRMEGIEIPNPNHFSNQGSAGGAISMLSVNMMANSDFFTGAFPAEYGNAASGVFDIRLRKGNNEKRETALQIGVIGTEAALEGPIKKGYSGSYLINYRYSSLALLQKLGVKIVGDAIPKFQDLSFNINLPTKNAGNFTLFGIGGISQIYEEYLGKQVQYRSNFKTNLGVAGITHSYMFNEKTWLKSVVAMTSTSNDYLNSRYDTLAVFQHDDIDEKFIHSALRASITLNHKFNRKHSLKSGFIASKLGYSMKSVMYDYELEKPIVNLDKNGNTGLFQAFANWQYRISDKWTLNSGVHYSRFLLNGSEAFEPRIGVKWNVKGSQILSAGIGLHSRLEDLPIYYGQVQLSDGSIINPNKNLGYSKARHYVFGYETMLTEHLHVKMETYYQDLYAIPVDKTELNGLSMINMSQGFTTIAAKNSGTGYNYGYELTLEKYFSKRYYFMFTGSIYDSKYRGSDNVLRNTSYNGNYASSFLAGKEIKMGIRNTLSLNIRAVFAGGRRYTPVLLEESIAQGYGIYDNSRVNELQASAYWRTDLGISYTINKNKTTRVWKIDIQNATNRLNEYGRYFNDDSRKVEIATQAGIIPTLSYRLEF